MSEQELVGHQAIQDAVKKKYSAVAKSAEGMFKYETGKSGAIFLGYDKKIIQDIPADLMNAFCGVGNPLGIEAVAPGCSLLDIGCGAGFDLIVAARTLGTTGRVCGIDMTPEMLQRARGNFSELGIDAIELKEAQGENIPYDDNSFDVIISSGVINLAPEKKKLFKEAFRVLKPGGRMQFADIVVEKEMPQAVAAGAEAWAQ